MRGSRGARWWRWTMAGARARRSPCRAESCSMIDRLVEFCLQRRVAVMVLFGLLLGFGVYAWETLSVEAYPELGDVAAQVTTQVPGLAAEEIEQQITVPLERQING